MVKISIHKSTHNEGLDLNISTNKVFVYIVDTSKYELVIKQLWQCLSLTEQQQAKKYYTQELSNRYIIAHSLLRQILSKHTNHSLHNIEFIYNEYGKPYLKNEAIQFNISHSHNKIAYAVTKYHQVGIDMEQHKENIDVMEMTDLVFTHNEANFLAQLLPHEKIDNFYNLWTKKESLIKALGLGLSYPMNTIEALHLQSGDKIMLTDSGRNLNQILYYYQLKSLPGYSCSLAVSNQIDELVYIESLESLGF